VHNQYPSSIESAAIVLPCSDLDACIEFFTTALSFRVDSIFPADAPTTAVISGHGLRIRLQIETEPRDPGTVHIECSDPSDAATHRPPQTAPNGTRIEFGPGIPIHYEASPPSTLCITRILQDAPWVKGRAGMLYRDLIPHRLGGHAIASHIKILDAGPVPDSVHHHDVQFQAIYCHRGWVRVVYEGQGPAFVLESGDCVLQPPGIRHRVLESSAGLEVIEIACPASHQTHIDHELKLPTTDPQRSFNAQQFVRHQGSQTIWQASESACFAQQDFGVANATQNLASMRRLRSNASKSVEKFLTYESQQVVFAFVTQGSALLHNGCKAEPLGVGDAVTIPEGQRFEIEAVSPGNLEFLEVQLTTG
jgi:mannose-6-phosphate isomerase-like protein (cupin superfamily)